MRQRSRLAAQGSAADTSAAPAATQPSLWLPPTPFPTRCRAWNSRSVREDNLAGCTVAVLWLAIAAKTWWIGEPGELHCVLVQNVVHPLCSRHVWMFAAQECLWLAVV